MFVLLSEGVYRRREVARFYRERAGSDAAKACYGIAGERDALIDRGLCMVDFVLEAIV